jgi:hypothetical protein
LRVAVAVVLPHNWLLSPGVVASPSSVKLMAVPVMYMPEVPGSAGGSWAMYTGAVGSMTTKAFSSGSSWIVPLMLFFTRTLMVRSTSLSMSFAPEVFGPSMNATSGSPVSLFVRSVLNTTLPLATLRWAVMPPSEGLRTIMSKSPSSASCRSALPKGVIVPLDVCHHAVIVTSSASVASFSSRLPERSIRSPDFGVVVELVTLFNVT